MAGSDAPTRGASHHSAVIADRFHLEQAPTLLARSSSVAPVAFTRLRSATGGKARDAHFEDAFSIHVTLRPVTANLWSDGRPLGRTAAVSGSAYLFDLTRNPVSEIHGAYDLIRFYISRNAMEELSPRSGTASRPDLVMARLGAVDSVLHGLALAVTEPVEGSQRHSTLFIDHVALAFHAHLVEAYGAADPPPAPGELASWQLRRATGRLLAEIDGDPTIADLARDCGLSAGHFARAFRRTTGETPHRWLVRQRVARARELLVFDHLGLAEIASACGFADQSHFTRVFTRWEGESPGRWRRAGRHHSTRQP